MLCGAHMMNSWFGISIRQWKTMIPLLDIFRVGIYDCLMIKGDAGPYDILDTSDEALAVIQYVGNYVKRKDVIDQFEGDDSGGLIM